MRELLKVGVLVTGLPSYQTRLFARGIWLMRTRTVSDPVDWVGLGWTGLDWVDTDAACLVDKTGGDDFDQDYEWGQGCLPGGTGCYSATLPSPLVHNRDPGCNTGCYKVQQKVLQVESESRKLEKEIVIRSLTKFCGVKFPYVFVDVSGQAASFSRELFHGSDSCFCCPQPSRSISSSIAM